MLANCTLLCLVQHNKRNTGKRSFFLLLVPLVQQETGWERPLVGLLLSLFIHLPTSAAQENKMIVSTKYPWKEQAGGEAPALVGLLLPLQQDRKAKMFIH